jgi:hypothetical protein
MAEVVQCIIARGFIERSVATIQGGHQIRGEKATAVASKKPLRAVLPKDPAADQAGE